MRWLAILVLALGLGVMGCSDGESASASVGYLVGPAVAGMEYETATQRGVTDAEGLFRYQEGETIRFLLGDNVLGEVVAARELTPFDLAGAPVVTGTLSLCDALGTHSVFHSTGADHPCRVVRVPRPRVNETFNALVNLVVLLQTLDEDGDPQNGIEITPETRALVDDAEFDLDQPWERFAEDFALRRVIARANAEGLFSRVHGPINPAPALQHLYDALGIDPRINAFVLQSVDYGADDEPDEIRRMEYSASGNWTRTEWDFEADGVVDGQSRWEYDAEGNQTLRDSEVTDWTWEYDELGYLIRHTFADWTVTYERDEYGSVTREIAQEPVANTHVTLFTYDEEGRRISQVRDDGASITSTTWEYDALGNLVRRESDDDADGIPEAITVFEYDGYGNATRIETDTNADGFPETIITTEYAYDDAGNLIRSTQLSVDLDGSAFGVVAMVRSEAEYDEAGHVIRRLQEVVADINGDGVPETHTSEIEYDADGRQKVEGVEFDEDGNPIRAQDQVWTYDDDNALIREDELDHTGQPKWTKTYDNTPTGFGYVIGPWPRN